jgi:hypothetical protein
MSVLATDDFNRANNTDVGASWTPQSGETRFGIVSNTAQPSVTNADCGEQYSGLTWPNDQYAQAKTTVDAGTWSNQDGIGVGVRMAAAADTLYRAVINNNASNTIAIDRRTAGAATNLGFRSVTYGAGGVLKLEVQGTTLKVYYNGVQQGPI